MTEETKNKKRGNLAKLHLFSSKTKLKTKGSKKDSQENGFHFEKEALLKEKGQDAIEENNCKQTCANEKKNTLTASIKHARKNLLPQLGHNRHRKIPRQTTIDIADIKTVAKVQQTNDKKSELELDRSIGASSQSLQHLDLAGMSAHRRTATCEELEKYAVDQTGTKNLYTMRKDLLTFQRLREWSFL